MKTTKTLLSILAVIFTISLYGQTSGKLVSSKSHVKFFSHTSFEDIEANNYTSVGTINTETGDMVFSVPMQGFEFEKSLMQKHFNGNKFLDTKKFPKAKFKGKITNLDQIDFNKDGSYDATVEGDLTIKGETNSINEKGTVVVKGNQIEVQSKFNVTLADYKITFVEGKPSTNIAKTVEISVIADFTKE
ncbi:MAG: YceI family protein [Chlorobi bacterium]|nr:YceI family protein [Chlorobiota bacterium]